MTYQDLNDAASTAASSVTETIKTSGRDALYAATSGMSDVVQAAGAAIRDEATQRAEEGKDLIAEQGRRLADGLNDVAAEQGEGKIQSRVLQTIANTVSDASESLRGRTISSLLDDAERFARRNPSLFVAGAALTGFALARFAVASSQRASQDEDDDTDQMNSDEQASRSGSRSGGKSKSRGPYANADY